MDRAVLFDLGGTLIDYFSRAEFPAILEEAITKVRDYLWQRDLLHVSPEQMWQRVRAEDHESLHFRVRPLERRLQRIFRLTDLSQLDTEALCRCFLRPVFDRAMPYPETLPALDQVRAAGFRAAIVSNSPWGSPASLWREEAHRHGLADLVDALVFCGDVGWRKPAPQIYEHAAARLEVQPRDCLFIGDHIEWDLQGAQAAGMQAILLDRAHPAAAQHTGLPILRSLNELEAKLETLLPGPPSATHHRRGGLES